jgi:hypothetical protein
MVMPAQKSAQGMPPGIGVEAQFFSWHSQYIWQAGELALELPAPALPALELPALGLPALGLPALELPALLVEFVEPPAPPPESLDPQPSRVTHHEVPAMKAVKESDRILNVHPFLRKARTPHRAC